MSVIIYLIGFAGTGKYTIAKEIAKMANYKLVDNHLINNPIFSVIGVDGFSRIDEEVWVKVREIRSLVLDSIKKFSPDSFNFIFTNELIENYEKDLQAYKKIEELAKSRDSVFLPVRLICSKDELVKRIVSPERSERFKATNPEYAIKLSENHEVFKPDHKNTVTIDVSNLKAKEVAINILNIVNNLDKKSDV